MNLLLRDIAPNLKKDIEKKAKSSNRSLSDEIKHLIRLGLLRENESDAQPNEVSLGEALRNAFSDCLMNDEEHAEFTKTLEEHRKEMPRPVPDFK